MTESSVTGTRSLESFLDPGVAAAAVPAAAPGATRAPIHAHVGEVIESSTTDLVAQARQLHGSPDFGAFVRIESDGTQMVGVVFNASTQSLEPNRRPTAYGKTEAELRREQPQIFELLRTHFEVFVLGYFEGTGVVHLYPPQPARIHSFVHDCTREEVLTVTDSDQFLRSILAAPGVPADELVLACLRQALRVRDADAVAAYLVRMGSELARLLRDDYDRLSSLVRRMSGWGEAGR